MDTENVALLEQEPEPSTAPARGWRTAARPGVGAVLLLASAGVALLAWPSGRAPSQLRATFAKSVAQLRSQSGEEVCEGQGFDEEDCTAKGCCVYDDDHCWSAVQQNQCSADNTPAPVPPMTGEQACEHQEFDRDACKLVGCCQWDGGHCHSAIGKDVCDAPPPPAGPEDDIDKGWTCDKLPQDVSKTLQDAGVTKQYCPHNILIAGKDDVPDEWLQAAASVLEELVDHDNDGVCDDPLVCSALSFVAWDQNGRTRTMVWAGSGRTGQDERFVESVLNDAYCFGLQVSGAPEAFREIVTEEIFHMVHQFAWAKVYREKFRMDDTWQSTLGKEVAKHECVQPGWGHPENECPPPAQLGGNAAPVPIQGTCAYESCDAAEFFHQAVLTFIGQRPGWDSQYMPRSAREMTRMLTPRFQAALKNPRHALPRRPLMYNRGPLASRLENEGIGVKVEKEWDLRTLHDLFHEETANATQQARAHGIGARRRSSSAAWAGAKRRMRDLTAAA